MLARYRGKQSASVADQGAGSIDLLEAGASP